jgi:SagB-type dehydrogenase family enzyme
MKENTYQHQASADLLFSPAEVYHENSKLRESDKAIYHRIGLVNTSYDIRRVVSRPFPKYDGYPCIKLPYDTSQETGVFERIVLERRSERKFSGEPISLPVLAKILCLGDGISKEMPQSDGTNWLMRTAPSGGALFPIDLYCIALKVDGIDPGLYYFHTLQNNLIQLNQFEYTQKLLESTYLDESLNKAAAFIFMSAVMPRIKFKYGERAYRFTLLEAGHIAQNLLLATHAMGLGGLPVGGFIDDKINDILQLDGCDEIALYGVLIGALVPF